MLRSFALFACFGALLLASPVFAEQLSCSFHHDRCVNTAQKAALTDGQITYEDKQTGQMMHAPLTPAMCDTEKEECLKTGEWIGPATHSVKKNLLKE